METQTYLPETVVSMAVGAAGTGRQQAYAGAAQNSADPFAAVIAQMMLQMQQNAEGADASQTLLSQTQETDSELQQRGLAQGMAGLLQYLPQTGGMDVLGLLEQQNDTGALSALGSDTQSASWADMTPLLQSVALQSAGTSQGTLAALMAMLGNPQSTALGQATSALSPEQGNAGMLQELQAAVAQTELQQPEAAGTATEQESGFSQLMQNRSAQTSTASKAETTSVQALETAAQEAAIQRPTALSETQMAKAEAISREPQLLAQLEKGVNETLAAGKQEFTMKLKPESLGEITVKLVEQDGRLTLNLTTASAQTAKLINNDLAALREAVKPMNVEVHEAVQQTGAASGRTEQQSAFTDFFGSQQQFANQQFANQQQAYQQREASHRQPAFSLQDALSGEDSAEAQPIGAASALDTYV